VYTQAIKVAKRIIPTSVMNGKTINNRVSFMRLLIADSDPLILRSLKISLSLRNDIEVVGLIADGADAVNMCKAKNPDFVLLDTRLESTATTRQIKAHCPNVKVILFTLYGETSEVQEALQAGASDYIIKADGMSSMFERLRTIAQDN